MGAGKLRAGQFREQPKGLGAMIRRAAAALSLLLLPAMPAPAQPRAVNLESLLREMAGHDALARLADPPYRSLQASSYNRASVRRGEPGWFADSDGIGFIRTEPGSNAKTEWVIMEHDGPGAITRFWTPFFYYRFDNRVGPNVKIYLDGSRTPVIDSPFIALLTGHSFLAPPFAIFTARAGVAYLPIPFSRSCKVTLDSKSFYFTVGYRAYPPGTPVTTFTREGYEKAQALREATARALLDGPPATPSAGEQELRTSGRVAGRQAVTLRHRASHRSGAAIRQLSVRIDPAVLAASPSLLRTLILEMSFDGEQTVWCPLGDFFSNADALREYRTWTRQVTAAGEMTSRWVMPFRDRARVRLRNLGRTPVNAEVLAYITPWNWDDRSMHFHANWRPDDVLPGTPFLDWNFIDISGTGVLVGDSFTVLSPGRGWWGEGDEKIYVDGAWDSGFPTHFGTGTEDYYGWAGGRVPTRADIFSMPFGANVAVGSTPENNPRGFNICSRIRSLDAIPFDKRLVFDMEASPGVDIRKPWDLLGYSAVVYWYARPGAVANRPPMPNAARTPIMSLDDLELRQWPLREAPR
jgi:hypothetical protein